jgi:hypothetical protein
MSEPKSLDQLHQECLRELQSVGAGEDQRGFELTRAVEWLPYLPLLGMTWSAMSLTIWYLLIFSPLKRKLKELRELLDRHLLEMRKNGTTELSPEVQKLIAEQRPLLEQGLAELQGKVTTDGLNGARHEVAAHLETLGAPAAEADEAAAIVTDIVGKPLLARPNAGKPPPSGQPPT